MTLDNWRTEFKNPNSWPKDWDSASDAVLDSFVTWVRDELFRAPVSDQQVEQASIAFRNSEYANGNDAVALRMNVRAALEAAREK